MEKQSIYKSTPTDLNQNNEEAKTHGIRIRLADGYYDKIFWERIKAPTDWPRYGESFEVLITGDKIVEVPYLTPKMKAQIAQGILIVDSPASQVAAVLPDTTTPEKDSNPDVIEYTGSTDSNGATTYVPKREQS